jgi:prevent-host-death family protein
MKTVTLREANKNLSKLVREIEREGEGYVITRRGRPVARLVRHAMEKSANPNWEAARERMKRLHAKGLDLGGLKIDRDALYDRL